MSRTEGRGRLLAAFGEAVRELRTEFGVSQEELGQRCGLNRTYVSGLELGTRNPTLWVLWRLSRGLDTSLTTLLKRVEIRLGSKT